jgi:transaldolase
MTIAEKMSLGHDVEQFLRSGFSPHFDKGKFEFGSRAVWRRFKELGTWLWLDTGSISSAEELWTQEFYALTTNNTLLNRSVQTGRYDLLICDLASLLDSHPGLSERDRMLEFAFMLTCWHGLRLVERFQGYVSVEEHTSLAGDVDKSVEYAQRFFDVCPV